MFRLQLSIKFMSTSVRSTAASGSQVYDTQRAVNEYLLFHFGDSTNKSIQMPYSFGPIETLNFTQRTAALSSKYANVSSSNKMRSRVLDVGCAVGGSSFELSKAFDEVTGIDFSQYFIDAANEMKLNRKKSYEILKQGKIFQQCTAEVPTDIDTSKVTFQQGDACNLSPTLGNLHLLVSTCKFITICFD